MPNGPWDAPSSLPVSYENITGQGAPCLLLWQLKLTHVPRYYAKSRVMASSQKRNLTGNEQALAAF